MSDTRRFRSDVAAVLLALGATLASCGGGGSPAPPSSVPPATTPPATTPPTTAPPGRGPTLSYTVDRRAGMSPLAVGFDLCASRDGAGTTGIAYLADFEGEGLNVQGGCGFNHNYRSNGVTVRDTQVCVRDAAGRSACDTARIKSYVDVSISVNQTTGCAGTVVANANVLASSSADVRALAEVDQVQFEAFNAAGQSVDTRSGQKVGGTQWTTGTWNVNNTSKLRVRATVFAAGVRGDDTPEEFRPACGS